MRLFLLLFAGISFGSSGCAQSPGVEIYLVNTKSTADSSASSASFHMLKSELQDRPFINDGDILFYCDSTFEITVSSAAAEIIASLKPDLSVGVPFVLTVDREPIFTGYFTNVFSSFTSDANSIVVKKSKVHKILKGIPEYHFEKTIPEQRNDPRLIHAMRTSARLK